MGKKPLQEAFDLGAVQAIDWLEKYRKQHPIRWWLTGGKPFMDMVKEVAKMDDLEPSHEPPKHELE
jgi:hypothetical protein